MLELQSSESEPELSSVELEAELDSIRQREIDRCAQAVEDEEKSQWMASSYEELIAAKKESVALQLEAEYRARIKDAFTQVSLDKSSCKICG